MAAAIDAWIGVGVVAAVGGAVAWSWRTLRREVGGGRAGRLVAAWSEAADTLGLALWAPEDRQLMRMRGAVRGLDVEVTYRWASHRVPGAYATMDAVLVTHSTRVRVEGAGLGALTLHRTGTPEADDRRLGRVLVTGDVAFDGAWEVRGDEVRLGAVLGPGLRAAFERLAGRCRGTVRIQAGALDMEAPEIVGRSSDLRRWVDEAAAWVETLEAGLHEGQARWASRWGAEQRAVTRRQGRRRVDLTVVRQAADRAGVTLEATAPRAELSGWDSEPTRDAYGAGYASWRRRPGGGDAWLAIGEAAERGAWDEAAGIADAWADRAGAAAVAEARWEPPRPGDEEIVWARLGLQAGGGGTRLAAGVIGRMDGDVRGATRAWLTEVGRRPEVPAWARAHARWLVEASSEEAQAGGGLALAGGADEALGGLSEGPGVGALGAPELERDAMG